MDRTAATYLLINAAPEYVFDWLKGHSNPSNLFSIDSKEELEQALLSRNEAVIDLGLALYGSEPSTGQTLLNKDIFEIKKAVLSGTTIIGRFSRKPWIENTGFLTEVLSVFTDTNNENERDKAKQLLECLFKNRHIPRVTLENLYTKSSVFSDLDETNWTTLIAFSTTNPLLSEPYIETYMDGGAEYSFNKLFGHAWKLFETLPVNTRNSSILYSLGNSLVTDGAYGIDPYSIAERWTSANTDENEDYSYIRTTVASLIQVFSEDFKNLKRNEDIAMRRSYYQRQPYPTLEDIKEGVEKDGGQFLEAAMQNKHFFIKEEIRSALRKACWDFPDERSDMIYPNRFKSMEGQFLSSNPEWFVDEWTHTPPYEEIENIEIRDQKRAEHLSKQMAEVHHFLLGKNETLVSDESEGKPNRIVDEFRSELVMIGQLLGNINKKIAFPIGWILISGTLGFLLGIFWN